MSGVFSSGAAGCIGRASGSAAYYGHQCSGRARKAWAERALHRPCVFQLGGYLGSTFTAVRRRALQSPEQCLSGFARRAGHVALRRCGGRITNQICGSLGVSSGEE